MRCIAQAHAGGGGKHRRSRHDHAKLDEHELVPLQLVPCNPGCKIPNLGCAVPFSFSDCDESIFTCRTVSIKGGLPYGNGTCNIRMKSFSHVEWCRANTEDRGVGE